MYGGHRLVSVSQKTKEFFMSVFIYRYSKIVLQTELPCVIIIESRCVAPRDASDTFLGCFWQKAGRTRQRRMPGGRSALICMRDNDSADRNTG